MNIERQIRRWKREESAMRAAEQDAEEAAAKTAKWQGIQRDFIRQTGLKRQYDREMVANAAKSGIIEVYKTSTTAKPNAITQVRSVKGGISRNYYDENGRWVKQITNNDHGNSKKHPFGVHGEHAHDIVRQDGRIVSRIARELTEQERKEMEDIL